MYYAFIELFTNRMKVKVKHLQRFFSSDASGGIVLIIAAALAMVMANTSVTSGLYHSFLNPLFQKLNRCLPAILQTFFNVSVYLREFVL